jgi:hypothetical protein
MSVNTAESISRFLKLYDIKKVSIMGGEFFCNPNWLQILNILLPNLEICRLVTNGDWAEEDIFLNQLLPYNDRIILAISEDKWHTNKFTRRAVEQCEEYGFAWVLPSIKMQEDTALVPMGRLEGNPSGFYGMFSTYCSNPENQYSFLIDEIGDVFKCSFGVKRYTNINDHLDGSFPAMFREFNRKFYERAPMNCYRCSMPF